MMNCPFCAMPNLCDAEGDCWCFHIEIPSGLLELLPEASSKACICSACIRLYQQDSEAFRTKLNNKQKDNND